LVEIVEPLKSIISIEVAVIETIEANLNAPPRSSLVKGESQRLGLSGAQKKVTPLLHLLIVGGVFEGTRDAAGRLQKRKAKRYNRHAVALRTRRDVSKAHEASFHGHFGKRPCRKLLNTQPSTSN
jgi:hypothetical protein